jgi:hypothetical protein
LIVFILVFVSRLFRRDVCFESRDRPDEEGLINIKGLRNLRSFESLKSLKSPFLFLPPPAASVRPSTGCQIRERGRRPKTTIIYF